MSDPGWYPDPAGQPNHLRYFDGHDWAEAAVPANQVRATSPSTFDTPAAAGVGRPRRNRPAAIIIGVVVGVLALAVVAALIWQNTRPQTPAPTTSEPSTRAFDPNPYRCATAAPHQNTYPRDGRIHGGGLVFTADSDWNRVTGAAAVPAFASDGSGVQTLTSQDWGAMQSVGALSVADFPAPNRETALQLLHCTARLPFYEKVSRVEVINTVETTVDGRPGYRVDGRITTATPDAPIDLVTIAIVDTGNPESWGLFVGAAPESERQLINEVDSTLRSLMVE